MGSVCVTLGFGIFRWKDDGVSLGLEIFRWKDDEVHLSDTCSWDFLLER